MHQPIQVRNTETSVSFWSSYWNPYLRFDMADLWRELTLVCLGCSGAGLITLIKTLRLTNFWAGVVGCCTQGATVWWWWGCDCMFALSVFPGWSGRRWEGSGLQARCWAGGWCGWHTCHRGFQKIASSWTLVLETPRRLLPLRDSQPGLSWHKRETHSTTFKEPRQES